ncbi:MAG: hypothetical protein ABR536_05445 [Solirubrobacterales bacterium]
MSFARYAEGAAGLAAAALLIGYASVRLRGRLLPGWVAAPARLVEFVLGLALLTMLLQLLGAIGLLNFAGIVVGAALVAGAAHFLVQPRVGEVELAEEPELGPLWLQLGAAVIAVLVAAHWATGVQAAWANGMSGFDTLWYHAPFAARFAQEGSIDALHFTDPEYLHWFYPQNSELLHAGGIVLFGRDIFSPLLNLGWLALALLSAWCIGRPYGRASLSLVAVAIVLDTATMVPREAGSAANDIGAIALLLAAAAIMVTAELPGSRSSLTDPGVLICAGLAAGLALGTKLTIAVAVLALSAGVIVLAARGRRLWVAGTWFAAVAATGGFWFVRNMFHAAGNPFPWLAHNLNFLPGPERGLEGRDPFSVAHYLFGLDGGVVRTFFLSGLHDVLGLLWPLLLALAAGGMFAALARGRTPAIRMLGGVAIVAAVAYVFTPLGASGPEGRPDGFEINLRYLVPALALGLALLPLDRAFERRRHQYALGALFVVALASVVLFSKSKTAYQGDDAFLPGALLIGVVLFAPLGLVLLWESRPRLTYAVAAAVAVLAFAAGWSRQDDYLDGRYQGESRYQMQAAFRWANDVSGQRIGLAGTRAAFQQYGLYGRDVSNYVQYIGHPGNEGDFTRIADCPAFRTAVNAGRYDYLITTPDLDLNNVGRTNPAPENSWLLGDPALKTIVREGPVRVLEVQGILNPATCPAPR